MLLPRAAARQAALRKNLTAQGLNADAIDEIIEHNWAASTSSNHDSGWHQWERHCAEHLDDSRRDNPTAADVVNFLTRVRRGDFSDKDVETFSAEWVRKVRSTISATIAMWSERGSRIGEHPLVSSYIQSITNDDFSNRSRRKYRYDDTWDAELLFTWVRTVVESDAFVDLKAAGGLEYIKLLRSVLLPLARLLLCCRSHDLTCIQRGELSENVCVKFTVDVVGGLQSAAFRYYRPKQRHHLPVSAKGFTDYTEIDVVPDDPGICLATLAHDYYTASAALPRDDDAFFLSERTDKRHNGKYWGLSSDRCAKHMAAAMTAAGIPSDFLPHSARAAGQAHLKSQGYSDDDVMARANMSARTYVQHYRRRIRRQGDGAAGPSASA